MRRILRTLLLTLGLALLAGLAAALLALSAALQHEPGVSQSVGRDVDHEDVARALSLLRTLKRTDRLAVSKVVQTLARAFLQLGYRAVRFNFRGVGGSAGSWDEGRGEIDDALAVIAAERTAHPGLPGTGTQHHLPAQLARVSLVARGIPPATGGRTLH
jgi:hypothetical protein